MNGGGFNASYSGLTHRGPSGNIWRSRFRLDQMQNDPSKGYVLFDDFKNFGGTVASNVGSYASQSGSWKSYEDTGGSIAQLAGEITGVIRLSTSTTDNHETWLSSCGNAGVLGMISDTAGSKYLQAFEARVRFGQVTDTFNSFVGMSEEGLAAADTVSDAGAMASKDFLGFRVLEADGDELDVYYSKAGQTGQELIDGVQALAASTWYKLGWLYDPFEIDPAKRLKFFVDNAEQSTYVTDALIAAATFPDGEELAILLGLKNGAAAAKTLDVDWVAFGIQYDPVM